MPTRLAGFAAGAIIVTLLAGCQAVDRTAIDRRIVAEVATGSEVSPNLRALCMPGGRLSGSANSEKAEQWVADKLVAYGLSNVHFEPFAMTTWLDRRTEVTVLTDPPYKLEVVQALGNCRSTPADGVTAELVDVGQGTAGDFKAKADQLKGRFALASYGEAHRSVKMKHALEHGAVGLLHVSNLEDQVIVGTCHGAPNAAPGVAVSKRDGDKLVALLAEGKTVRINVQIEAEAWDCAPRNVIAEIPGRGPDADEVVILGAHLDSWHLAEGALDNGTGSATILEAARVLAGTEPSPRRTIRFIWFMGEEHGLFGSKAYVEAHQAELDRIVAMVNVDMPGEPRSLAHHGHPEIAEFLRGVVRALPGYEISEEIGESHGSGSDHAPFMRQGVCCISLSGEMGPGVKYYHTTGDKYEVVDRRSLNSAAAVLAVLVRRLADADPLPAHRVDPATVKVENGF